MGWEIQGEQTPSNIQESARYDSRERPFPVFFLTLLLRGGSLQSFVLLAVVRLMKTDSQKGMGRSGKGNKEKQKAIGNQKEWSLDKEEEEYVWCLCVCVCVCVRVCV